MQTIYGYTVHMKMRASATSAGAALRIARQFDRSVRITDLTERKEE